ncbi:hypothetical protein WJX75_000970 [Coccomyxa subellipsoidea]|uniref:WW domain-containing protein n=1 Tax=Coccomyxa subellipsoidea TaxID=248742 RepID=A0ABR2YIW7_9CHLO
MLHKKKSEGTTRRARLDIVNTDSGDADGSSSDTIAAALEERKKKQEESLRAAAAAAAKRAAANLTTYFADDIEPAPSSAVNGGLHTVPPAPQSSHPTAATTDAPASEDGDSMDAELANFMEELESSGLLNEGDNAGASGSTQAEQRVLGSLDGCPGWHEVMDMDSGKVYFWNEETDDVAWDPPEGSVPRSKQQNDATFAAAHAAAPEAKPVSRTALDSRPAAEAAECSADAAVATPRSPQEESMAAQYQGSRPAGGLDRQPDELPAQDDPEEGEIDKRTAAVERPAEEVGTTGEELLTSAWEAAERICGPVPLLVRLAVEVEVRLRDWRTFSEAQRRAADSGERGRALSWASYQRSVQENWRTLQAALPMALTEAEAGLAAATAAIADASAAAAGAPQVPEAEDGEEERKRKREKAGVGTGPLAKKKKALKVGKATSSLIDKWAAVRKDLVEEGKEEDVLDADALARKRLREAEEWRLKQLRAGVSSEDNSNFQPLAVDWREKLKTSKKAAAEPKRKPASVQQAPVTYNEKPDLEALSVGLPAGWKALWDKTSKEVYYANPKTKETSWEKPT